MTTRDPALEPFDALIGTWATEATHPQFEGVVPGSVTLEWDAPESTTELARRLG